MFGRITLEETTGILPVRHSLEEERLCGVSFLLGRARFLPGDLEPKRKKILKRLLRRMAAAGVRQVVLPFSFPYGKELYDAGLSPFPTLGLYRAVAPQLALFGLQEAGIPPKRATVVLSASQLSRSLWRAAFMLSKLVRYLVVDLEGSGGEALRRALCAYTGLPALSGKVHRADFTLHFQAKGGCAADGPGFLLCPGAEHFPAMPRLYRGAFLSLPPGLPPLPLSCPAVPLLAVLLELSRVRAEEITVERLSDKTLPWDLPAPDQDV